MTDLELVKACAEAMGYAWDDSAVQSESGSWIQHKTGTTHNRFNYNPLEDDAQAMALAKRFHIAIAWTGDAWSVGSGWGALGDVPMQRSADLNRAVVECVAKIHAAR